jgi:hypothetical protein
MRLTKRTLEISKPQAATLEVFLLEEPQSIFGAVGTIFVPKISNAAVPTNNKIAKYIDFTAYFHLQHSWHLSS